MNQSVPFIIQAAARIAELDVAVGMASAALEYDWNRPCLTEVLGSADAAERVAQELLLVIQGGRHPLISIQGDRDFIPNTTELGGDHRQLVQLLAGPNSSGKSVYLTQVGLITVTRWVSPALA